MSNRAIEIQWLPHAIANAEECNAAATATDDDDDEN